jgi:hypothetical protein
MCNERSLLQTCRLATWTNASRARVSPSRRADASARHRAIAAKAQAFSTSAGADVDRSAPSGHWKRTRVATSWGKTRRGTWRSGALCRCQLH